MSECKTCWVARGAVWRAAHPGKSTEYKRRWRERNPEFHADYHYRNRYGVSAAEVAAKAEAQDHKCMICGEEVPLRVDHNHQTGVVRDLLCQSCNVLLGMAKEKVEVLQQAIAYLERHASANERHGVRG